MSCLLSPPNAESMRKEPEVLQYADAGLCSFRGLWKCIIRGSDQSGALVFGFLKTATPAFSSFPMTLPEKLKMPGNALLSTLIKVESLQRGKKCISVMENM